MDKVLGFGFRGWGSGSEGSGFQGTPIVPFSFLLGFLFEVERSEKGCRHH